MNNRGTIFFAGALLVYGVYSLRQGIKTRKAADIAVGVVCILGGAVGAVVSVIGTRNR
jgi:uncharacterized membrane protein HdeD (DUF308 family)